MEYQQQGDVLIFKIDEIPAGAKKLNHLVLAEGEETGRIDGNIDGKKRSYLKMVNPSTGEIHIKGVDPSCNTINKAIILQNQQY